MWTHFCRTDLRAKSHFFHLPGENAPPQNGREAGGKLDKSTVKTIRIAQFFF